MEVTQNINGKQVVFEAVEMVDNHGHSREWSMEGYTEGIHTHNATGSFTYTDEFEEITDIEECTGT